MTRRLRPVELDFAASAPLRLVFTAEVSAAQEEVYVALAEEVEDWPKWFDAVAHSRPTEGGRGREIRLRGGVRFQETIMAAQAIDRYAYRVDETNVPGLRALLEDWRLAGGTAGRTRIQWIFAVDGPAPLRVLLKLARPGLAQSFRRAVRKLDRRLAAAV